MESSVISKPRTSENAIKSLVLSSVSNLVYCKEKQLLNELGKTLPFKISLLTMGSECHHEMNIV